MRDVILTPALCVVDAARVDLWDIDGNISRRQLYRNDIILRLDAMPGRSYPLILTSDGHIFRVAYWRFNNDIHEIYSVE